MTNVLVMEPKNVVVLLNQQVVVVAVNKKDISNKF